MTDLLSEVERLRRDRESVEAREIELPRKLSAAKAELYEQRSLMRALGPKDAASPLLPSVQAWTQHERKKFIRADMLNQGVSPCA